MLSNLLKKAAAITLTSLITYFLLYAFIGYNHKVDAESYASPPPAAEQPAPEDTAAELWRPMASRQP